MSKSNLHTSQPILYGIFPYDRSGKVRWLFAELGIEFETRWLNRDKKENESPAFLELNPMGRVPVLQIDGQVMVESAAICTYLADRFSYQKMAPALDSPERAKYLQWIQFASSTIEAFQTRIMIIEDIPPGEVYNAKFSALRSDLRDAMVTLDRALDKKSFLVGDRLSVADIFVSYHLFWCALWPELNEVITEFPRVVAYVDSMKKTPSATQMEVFSYPG